MNKSPYKIINEYEETLNKEFQFSSAEMLKNIIVEIHKNAE